MQSPYSIDMGRVTYSAVNSQDGYHEAQVDGNGDGAGATGTVHFPLGLFSRAADPVKNSQGQIDPEQACGSLFWRDYHDLHVMPLTDPRFVDKFPNLEQGETILYAGAGQFIRLHKTGTITLATTDNGGALEGNPVTLQLRPDALAFVAPWGKLTFDKHGLHIVTAFGAKFTMGAMSGLPPPLDSLSTFVNVSASNITLDAPLVTIGPKTGTPDNGVKFSKLLAQVVAMRTELAAVELALSTLTVGPTPATSVNLPAVAVAANATAIAESEFARSGMTAQAVL